VRVGPVSGAEPHLLLGHQEQIKAVAVSPDGDWIFSAAGSEIRRWPMSDLTQPPLHALPASEFLREMHARTNLRVVESPDSPGGWKIEVSPFSQ
jgi:WD40 repeat protein